MMGYTYDVALSFATEEQALVTRVYHNLKEEGLRVFFAPAQECQAVLSGENQREVFYRIFGLEAEYVVLFVSKHYISKDVPMEEAEIAFAKHGENGTAIAVYLDEAELPQDLLDPKTTNYYKSKRPAFIAGHVAAKIKKNREKAGAGSAPEPKAGGDAMVIRGNSAGHQVFIQNLNGRC